MNKLFKEMLFISVINPVDSPRLESRLKPLLSRYVETSEAVSCREQSLSLKKLLGIYAKVKKAKKGCIFVATDPLALLLLKCCFIPGRQLVYDRNERWPKNFKYRKKTLIKFLSYFSTVLAYLEQYLTRYILITFSVDTITASTISKGRYLIIPNRNYSVRSLNPLFSYDSQHVLYFGTFSEERGRKEILSFLSVLNQSLEQHVTIDVWTRRRFHLIESSDKSSRIVFHNYAPFGPDHAVTKNKYKFAIMYVSEKQFPNILPSKISAYWQMGIPVVVIGGNRATRLLSKFYPSAIIELCQADASCISRVRKWLKYVHVDYKPREIFLERYFCNL